MKQVMILGASGMAGHMIYQYLKSLNTYHITTVTHTTKIDNESYTVDVYDLEKLTVILQKEQPDYVINCVGILISGSKTNPKNTIYVNAYFPHKLSEIVHKIKNDAQVIHISSDCVFSGKKGQYADYDEKDALDVYGMTKNLGELINEQDLTIRTSIIGPELKENGEGLFHWLLQHKNDEFINGYEKSIWSGVTTLELAKCIQYVLEHERRGIYQLSNNEQITKYQLLLLIAQIFNLKIDIKKIDGIVSNKSIISSTNNDTFFYSVPSYSQMIEELYRFTLKNKQLYEQYFS